MRTGGRKITTETHAGSYTGPSCGLGMEQLHYNVSQNTLWSKQEAGGYSADPNTGYHHLPPLIDTTSSHSYAPTRDLMVEGDSLSSTLAGLRESYYDYNIPKPTEI